MACCELSGGHGPLGACIHITHVAVVRKGCWYRAAGYGAYRARPLHPCRASRLHRGRRQGGASFSLSSPLYGRVHPPLAVRLCHADAHVLKREGHRERPMEVRTWLCSCAANCYVALLRCMLTGFSVRGGCRCCFAITAAPAGAALGSHTTLRLQAARDAGGVALARGHDTPAAWRAAPPSLLRRARVEEGSCGECGQCGRHDKSSRCDRLDCQQ